MTLETSENLTKRKEKLNSIMMGEDELGLGVRGHIMIEQELIDYISVKLVDRDILKSLNLEFNQYVKLAAALGLPSEKGPALQAHGTLRNGFAHNIDKKISESDANNIYKSLDEHGKEITNSSYEKIPNKSVDYFGKKIRNISPKDRVILCIITIWAGIATDVARAKNAA